MEIYKLTKKNRESIKLEIESGAVFIYPTDTVYGIGCNALDSAAVRKIKEIKQRETPLSIIAPSKEWIIENCEAKSNQLKKLPGHYTLIFKLKNKNAVASEVSKETIGVRIPDHEISSLIKELGFPVITTSANLRGDSPMSEIKKLKGVDFAIDEGKIAGTPSTIIDLTGKIPKRLR